MAVGLIRRVREPDQPLMNNHRSSDRGLMGLFWAGVSQNLDPPLQAIPRLCRCLETPHRERAGAFPTHLRIGLEDGIKRCVHAIKDADEKYARGISQDLWRRIAPREPNDHCVSGNGAEFVGCLETNPPLRIQGTQLPLEGRMETALSTVNYDDRVTFCV